MTVYGPDITDALIPYATQFDELEVAERQSIIDLSATNPLSQLREVWQNATTDLTEHKIETSGSNQLGFIETEARGQYTSGYEAQSGIGVRLPHNTVDDGVEKTWGYYRTDGTGTPLDGWQFGVDGDGIFVTENRNDEQRRVYQQQWNQDVVDGDGDADENPSGYELDLSKGHIFQIDFIYYGYGPVEMSLITDEGRIVVHKFTHEDSTSIGTTNLPIRADVSTDGTVSTTEALFVGGRQFSVVGEKSSNDRKGGHYRDELTSVDDTQWYPLVSVKIKDGSDFPRDLSYILGQTLSFEIDTDNTRYRWQVRQQTAPSSPSWEIPSTHEDTPTETAAKVDVTATDIQDGNGDLTGVHVDGGTLSAGSKNEQEVQQSDSDGQITDDTVISLVIRATPANSGTVSEIFLEWEEMW